jgi:triosephosphate isomerase (TIM)
MKNIIIVGNWKSNKTVSEAEAWFNAFEPKYLPMADAMSNTTVILSVPFTDLYLLHKKIGEVGLPVKLGAQDVSPFSEGAFTGEESGRMIKELADWVIIGHSERRKLLHEDDTELFKEVEEAKKAGLKVIYCVSDVSMSIPEGVDIIGYEPVWAIGTGKTDTPENANEVIGQMKEKSHVAQAVYGGSVTPDNVGLFVAQSHIDGALIGGASLDPVKFFDLIQRAQV